MQQLAVVLVWVDVAGLCALWWATLYKLLPLYRSGAIQGNYRPAFQFVLAALAWATMQVIVWLFLKADAAAMLLNVLWAIGLISWALLAVIKRTRRNVFAADTAQAQPPPRYTVRTTPRVQPAAANTAGGRSALAQAAMRRAVSA